LLYIFLQLENYLYSADSFFTFSVDRIQEGRRTIVCACVYVSVDLQLAAELGKALLERNVDLESQLHNLQQTCSEQESEITVSK